MYSITAGTAISLLLDAFILEYFETKAGEQGVQELINQVLTEYIHNCDSSASGSRK